MVVETEFRSEYSIDELSAECGVHPEFISRLVSIGLLEPVGADRFDAEARVRLGRILRLRRDLGVNYAGAALILELLDRISALEARIHELER
ncbi:MAG: MerR family transcriptional regulator [Deltaproteobacteria bacterium]|nr:MerR family transcriptional regulator [Deltaproteobacteria bacterium]